jgi:site-specific recombinase XerD
MTVTKNENEMRAIQLQGTSYRNFINAISSPATKRGYERSLKRYLNHLKMRNADELLANHQYPRLIESQIIDYIMSLRQADISYATIKYLVSPIFTFYQLNDLLLNKNKVFRYLGEYKKVVKDQAYSTKQIQQALQNADQRMRCIILLLASTGCRIGALPALTLGNLTRLPNYGLYKITFYESTNNEYYNFCTRECAQTGINTYLSYRMRCNEKISFNENTQKWEPDNTPLIRQQFDMNDVLQARHPKPMSLQGLRVALNSHLVKSGLRQIEHPTENNKANYCKRISKTISLSNGFRKHVISTFIEAQLNHEIRELIVDHASGLDSSYFRPTEKQVLEEYLKAEPLLTTDPAMKLQKKVETLEVEKASWLAMREELDGIKHTLGLS